ncbi:NAD(P)-dependent oxidoreductase [Acidimangrovimonas sediminis]|uniref:NAD(P)-dependent oxidoreductase n=1 Tax=Acidimangrovimonas sediminis TaxID=2056283 RepID=UPI000C803BD6|nr:NAD(P)-dependent oxidoreductase [Acidimangrovimonas sediminis]
MKVGFIGLGQMGSGIAGNLLKAGHEVTVWNRSPDKADSLVEAGAARAATPAEAAQGDVVMTMLADDKAVESVVFGEDGIAGCPALHVSHSTISIELSERLEAAMSGAGGYVAAPVFGRPEVAAAGNLFVIAAGPADALDRCAPLFDAIGQRSFVVGDHGPAANLVKLCGNFMIMTAVESMAEAMTLAEKGGIERQALLEVLTGTLFGSPINKTYGEILVNDRFRPAGFAAPLGLKDMTLVDEAARRSNVPMPFLGTIRDHLKSVIATEGPDIDWGAAALAVRRGAGLGN